VARPHRAPPNRGGLRGRSRKGESVNWEVLLPVLTLWSSLATGIVIFLLREDQYVARTTLNIAGATLKVIFVGVIVWGFEQGFNYEARWSYMPGLDLVLRVDAISLLFLALSAVLWLVTTIYAIGYLEGSPNRSRFFGFFSLCVTATVGIALAGNLVTFFLFYEMLSVVTYPLVVHRGTARSHAAGRTYLLYTLAGGVVLLLGVVWIQVLAGPVEFTAGGVLAPQAADHRSALIAIFALLIAGLGVKCALVPLHSWLPEAMVAPAPVSALLHAVAVVKAGAYGIVRVVYDLYGLELASSLGVLTPLAVVASVTIVYGSLRALSEREVKRRLAYSTVSQLSYIILGTAIFGPIATTGGLVHLVHQGLMKITLFFCAGNFAETLGIHYVHEMKGVGRRMPVSMAAFSLAAFGMMGVPPLAGFVSKWHLGLGGLEAGQWWVVAVLAASSVLNAAYFLPLVVSGWFGAPAGDWPAGRPTLLETRWTLLFPAVTTALLTLAAGVLAGWTFSPLGLARMIVVEMYGL
jgi:multicomponent Na+:H+ antiporter subunit D